MIFRLHALKRMVERRISPEDVYHILATGVDIEIYPEDQPYPSRLILGTIGSRPLHLVVADDPQDEKSIVITVYEADPEKWEAGFSRRKS